MAVLESHLLDDHFRVAFWSNVTLVDIWDDMDAERMRCMADAYRTLSARYPQGILGLVLLQPTTPVSSAEARQEITRQMNEIGPRLQHVAMVVEARGVLALMLRSVVRGVNVLLRRSSISLEVSVENAARTLQPFLLADAADGGGAALLDAVRSFRHDHQQRHAQSA
jgi:hypothetical protein